MSNYYKAIIRVIKSLSGYEFGSENVIHEPCIEAADKSEVKRIMVNRYPQFFQNGKIYEKETKDQAQFFYCLIYPLYEHEIRQINEGEWCCDSCSQKHENAYVSRPRISDRLYPGLKFCGQECLDYYWSNQNIGGELQDDKNYITKDSPQYIYVITEKDSGMKYVGKTRNAPFFRWWNHLKHSTTPFATKLRNSKLSDWTFEVIDVLPPNLPNSDVLAIESRRMIEFDSITNGFNTVISNKTVIQPELKDESQHSLF